MADIAFDQLDGHIWFNGEMVPWADTKIHLLTHALHYGSAVFEGQRIYGGKIFKLKEHCERLHDSAEILDFKVPYSVEAALRCLQCGDGKATAILRVICARLPGGAVSRWG